MNFKFDKHNIEIKADKVIVDGIIEVGYKTTSASDFISPELMPLIDTLMVINPSRLADLRVAAIDMWKALEEGHCAMHSIDNRKYLVYGVAISHSHRQIVASIPDMINLVVDGSLSKVPSLTLSTNVHTAQWIRRISKHINEQISEGMDCLSDQSTPSPLNGK